MSVVQTKRLPYYFYDINAVMPDGRRRWYDEFKDEAPSIIQPRDLSPAYMRLRSARNEAYAKWQAAFFGRQDGELKPCFKPKNNVWQVIQILSFKHSESSRKDWWENYQDALFRVFVTPETVYDPRTGEHKQWYQLSPEDCYLVNRHEVEEKHGALPPRDYNGRERFLSADKRLRRIRFVPVECCRHWRHETTAGELPQGL